MAIVFKIYKYILNLINYFAYRSSKFKFQNKYLKKKKSKFKLLFPLK